MLMAVKKTHPTEALIRYDDAKRVAIEDLGAQFDALVGAITEYREAFRGAASRGWARTDLIGAGFVDPKKLPHVRAYDGVSGSPDGQGMIDASDD